MTGSRPWVCHMVGVLVALGGVATGIAATASTWANVRTCGHDPSGECSALVRMLSFRVGLVVGVATVMMLLLVAGLHRMMVFDERRRAIDDDRSQ